MFVSPLHLSNNLLRRGFDEKIPITPMKLQKLLYFVCRDYLKKTDIALLSENFCVWQHGPVLITVYNEFKTFQAKPITEYAKNAECKAFMLDEDQNPVLTEVIDDVWSQYKHLSGIELSRITHRDHSGWCRALGRGDLTLTREDLLNDAC